MEDEDEEMDGEDGENVDRTSNNDANMWGLSSEPNSAEPGD